MRTMGTLRFYPALVWCRGPDQWHAQTLDFRDLPVGGGKTRQEALDAAQEALQERVNGIADHQELPNPSHRLVAEAKLVRLEAHGLELIQISTRLESDLEVGKEEKSNDSKHQGDEKKHGPGRRSPKRWRPAHPGK